MRLHQSGKTVRGLYEFGGRSTVAGEADGRTLHFKYEQPDGEKGEATFTLAEDGKSFTGTWKGVFPKGEKAAAIGGAWNGSRVAPQPGKVWLVVLEAPWRRGLEEGEYSFGLMLRTFFARVPRVQVRHRFFYNEEDLRHWCAELPYLAEPVVLHLSSHADGKGIQTCGHSIGAKAIAECLRDAGDLRLVHFGSCLVAGGDVPKQIFDALGADARFPISGYAKAADWGGSAVIDFTYLDLIFSHGLSPADAAAQTQKMLSFAGEKGGPRDAIAPAGLVIHPPPVGPTNAGEADGAGRTPTR